MGSLRNDRAPVSGTIVECGHGTVTVARGHATVAQPLAYGRRSTPFLKAPVGEVLPIGCHPSQATVRFDRASGPRADTLGHTAPEHYLWCASQHHKLDPTKPASKWDTAWRALRDAAGLPGLRFHDLRHTVVTRLLEAGEPDHVVESITGHLSRRMLEHYSHIRLNAKKAALDRLDASTKGATIKSAK